MTLRKSMLVAAMAGASCGSLLAQANCGVENGNLCTSPCVGGVVRAVRIQQPGYEQAAFQTWYCAMGCSKQGWGFDGNPCLSMPSETKARLRELAGSHVLLVASCTGGLKALLPERMESGSDAWQLRELLIA